MTLHRDIKYVLDVWHPINYGCQPRGWADVLPGECGAVVEYERLFNAMPQELSVICIVDDLSRNTAQVNVRCGQLAQQG